MVEKEASPGLVRFGGETDDTALDLGWNHGPDASPASEDRGGPFAIR